MTKVTDPSSVERQTAQSWQTNADATKASPTGQQMVTGQTGAQALDWATNHANPDLAKLSQDLASHADPATITADVNQMRADVGELHNLEKQFWGNKVTEDTNWVNSDPSNQAAQDTLKSDQGALKNFDDANYLQDVSLNGSTYNNKDQSIGAELTAGGVQPDDYLPKGWNQEGAAAVPTDAQTSSSNAGSAPASTPANTDASQPAASAAQSAPQSPAASTDASASTDPSTTLLAAVVEAVVEAVVQQLTGSANAGTSASADSDAQPAGSAVSGTDSSSDTDGSTDVTPTPAETPAAPATPQQQVVANAGAKVSSWTQNQIAIDSEKVDADLANKADARTTRADVTALRSDEGALHVDQKDYWTQKVAEDANWLESDPTNKAALATQASDLGALKLYDDANYVQNPTAGGSNNKDQAMADEITHGGGNPSDYLPKGWNTEG